MNNIALLGAGTMGTALAQRLLETGHHVTVWNRNPAKLAGFTHTAADPAAAVAGADLVILMLTDAAAVENVLFGHGAAAAARPGTVLVQMSTISPDEVRGIAAKLPPGLSFLDVPVGGSVGAARSGSLALFTGGADADIDHALPVLKHLGEVRRCGPIGTGSALKLVVNTAMVTALSALRDTLEVASSLAVPREVALDVLSGGPLAGAIRRSTATGASFAIALAAKDARLAQRSAPATPALAAALTQLDTTADQQADVSTLIKQEKP